MDKMTESQIDEMMIQAGTELLYFATRDEAWAFMRECDAKGIAAGFPSLKSNDRGYSVQVLK